MDELEHNLRDVLAIVAGDDDPSDALVARTHRRATHLRRQRRAFAAITIAAVIGVASIAGAQARNDHVTTPQTTPTSSVHSTSASSTTTQAPSTSTSTAPSTGPGLGSSQPEQGRSTVTTSPTPPATEAPLQCGPPPVIEDWSPPHFETLGNGDVRVSIGGRPTGPADETWVYAWDDGSPEPTRTFTPQEFGPHWYDLHWELNGIRYSCPQRVEIVVAPQAPMTTSPMPMP